MAPRITLKQTAAHDSRKGSYLFQFATSSDVYVRVLEHVSIKWPQIQVKMSRL